MLPPPLPPLEFKDLYKKIEYRIPMRDGVKLYTAVYVPRNASKPFPIMMQRTPYSAGPYGTEKYRMSREDTPFVKAGYGFAFQDVRGRYMSEGVWENVRPIGRDKTDDSTDCYDTVDFLVKNVKGNNGRLGLRGISYPGFYAGAGAINNHPALKAVSPQAPVTDWFMGDDVYHRDAFFVQDNWGFSEWFDVPRKGLEEEHAGLPEYDHGPGGPYGFYLRMVNSNGLETGIAKGRIPYWKEIMEHDTYDAYWKERALQNKMRGIKCAVLTVGGLFDAEDMWGAIHLYQSTEAQNPGISNAFVYGPWSHGQWADKGESLNGMAFGSDTSAWFQKEIEFPFFEHHLRGRPDPKLAEATVFETGANQWRRFASWPPKGLKAKAIYLAEGKKLAGTPPTKTGADGYENDPARPTPYLANREEEDRPGGLLAQDEAWNAKRDDVLTYQGAPLAAPLRVAGPVDADVWVTTTGTDMDLVVKVVDVWPAGSPYAGQMRMVRSEVIRGRFRDSFSQPKPFVPGQPTRIRLRLNDVLHTFGKGHRMGVMIQSSWFPLVDRNPNRFVNVHKAKASDYQKATIKVLRDPKHPSRILFGTL
ncbi:CocE/NonD family hydrolase [bacterium]|nr:MAG: CocE/NonD family hydrolase [bacterium]